MKLPMFNEIDGHRVLGKTAYEQWKKDVGVSGQPAFKTVSLSRGSQVWVVTEEDFLDWFAATHPTTVIEGEPDTEDENIPNQSYADPEDE